MRSHKSKFNFLKSCLLIFNLAFILVSCDVPDKLTYDAEEADIFELRTVTTEYCYSEVVYFTEGGSVWHRKKDCSFLKNSNDILSGTENDALIAGKEKPCSRCSK